MRLMTCATATLLALAACATNEATNDPELDAGQMEGDAGTPIGDGAADGDGDGKAERPLVCGETGYCETKLPLSSRGLPLQLRAVWAIAPNDVWSISAEGDILHYDGASWSTSFQVNHTLYALWATSTDVWVGGEGGLLLHRVVGGEWTRVPVGHVQPIVSIYGAAADDIWFTSRDSSVDHFDGSKITNHVIDVPGLRVTAVFGGAGFGGAGFGTYAAGYVKDPAPPSDAYTLVKHTPHLFALSSTGIESFNASLPERKGFVPMAGIATDAPDPSKRVLLFGYYESPIQVRVRYCFLGQDTLLPEELPEVYALLTTDGTRPPTPPAPLWAPKWDDIRYAGKRGHVLSWNGTSFIGGSLKMGYQFVPQPALGIHGVGADMWIVGEGYALKGPSQ